MICGILLAAGRSRRMGTQKLLLPFAGQTVVGQIVDQLLAGGIGRLFVVVSADREAVAAALATKNIILVDNPDPDGDMLSSIRCGLKMLPVECEAALIALGDQPGIRPDLVSRLIQLYIRSPLGIASPIYDGKRGHPIVIAHRFFAPLLADFDDQGLHGLLDQYPDEVATLAVDESNMLADIDLPADYQRLIDSSHAD
jgi:molybdenum cofactor cytidylyltransferase